MVYIEAILEHNHAECPFRIDADSMNELMKKSLKIVTDFIAEGNNAFNITAFDSNILSEYNFTQLIHIHMEMQE